MDSTFSIKMGLNFVHIWSKDFGLVYSIVPQEGFGSKYTTLECWFVMGDNGVQIPMGCKSRDLSGGIFFSLTTGCLQT